jgi:hypothetical protein
LIWETSKRLRIVTVSIACAVYASAPKIALRKANAFIAIISRVFRFLYQAGCMCVLPFSVFITFMDNHILRNVTRFKPSYHVSEPPSTGECSTMHPVENYGRGMPIGILTTLLTCGITLYLVCNESNQRARVLCRTWY